MASVTSRWVQARTRPPRRLSEHALTPQTAYELGGGSPCTGSVEEHQIGVRLLDRDARHLAQAACKGLGVAMVVGQPIHVMVERMQAGGGADAGLAHGRRRAAASSARPHR